MAHIDCVHRGQNILGESPIWSARDEALYWVDIHAPAIHRLHASSGHVKSWALPDAVGSIGLRARGGLLAAMKSGFHFFEPATGNLQSIVHPEQHLTENRFNDGRCDRAGRFWSGTMMSERPRGPVGALYCLEPDLTVRVAEKGITIPNSLAWSPDNRAMYFADSPHRRIWAYDFDLASGETSNRRVFVDVRDHPGVPDGATVDAEGCLWNAEHGGGRVCRYTPGGLLDRTIELPVTQPTCCAFGGPRLATLFITTAREGLSAEQLAAQPLAGAVFAVDPGVVGLPEPGFAG